MAWTELNLSNTDPLHHAVEPARVLPALAPRLSHLRVLRLLATSNGRRWIRWTPIVSVVLRLVRAGQLPRLRELHVTGRLIFGIEFTRGHELRALLAEADALTLVKVCEMSSDNDEPRPQA